MARCLSLNASALPQPTCRSGRLQLHHSRCAFIAVVACLPAMVFLVLHSDPCCSLLRVACIPCGCPCAQVEPGLGL